MLAKYITIIVLGLLVGVVLLNQRHQRIDAMHDMTRMHRQMNRTRQAIWTHQAHIAERIQPQNLQTAVERAGLELEPITPMPAQHTAIGRRPRTLEPMDAQQ